MKRFWITGFLAAAAFLALILIRMDVFARFFHPSKSLADHAVHGAARESWMSIFQNQRRIGFTHRRFFPKAAGYEMEEKIVMRINTMGMVQEIALRTRADLLADGSLDRFEFDIRSGVFHFLAQGAASGDRLRIHTETAGHRRTIDMPLNKRVYLSATLLDRLQAERLQPGDRYTFEVFDPALMAQTTVTAEVISREHIPIAGESVPAILISMGLRGMTHTAWISESGELVRERGLLGMRLEKTTPEQALSDLGAAASQDLAEAAAVSPSRPILELEHFRVEAERLFAGTDKAIFANFGGTAFGDIALVPAPWLKSLRGIRDIEEWYVSTVTRRNYVYRLFERQCEIALANLERIYAAVGDRVRLVFLAGADFGTQKGPFISNKTYRDLYAPFHREVNQWVHAHTPWKTFIHSCGSIIPLIEDFIEAGFDILNPVQTSAAGMDPRWLKETFGTPITVWGGGVDTQHVLPIGTPAQVRENVRQNLVRVVATIFPVADLVREIGGDAVQVTTLLPPGASPHTFEPAPEQVRAVAQAAVFVEVGAGLDTWAAKLRAARSGPQSVVTLTAGLPLLHAAPEHGPALDGNPDGGDPHVWLDPILVRDHCVPAILRALSQADSARQAVFQRGASDLAAALTRLDTDIRTALAAVANRNYVAFHAAWRFTSNQPP